MSGEENRRRPLEEGEPHKQEDALIQNLLLEEQEQEQFEAYLEAQAKAAAILAEESAKIPVTVFESSSEEAQWLSQKLLSDAAKLWDLYQGAVKLESKTVELDSATVADLAQQLAKNTKSLEYLLRRSEYDQALEVQRASAVVGKTSFRTPTNWGPTRLTHDTVEATLAEVRSIKHQPLPSDFWPQPVHPKVETAIVPADRARPSMWKRFLYFLGFDVPEITRPNVPMGAK